MLPLKQGYDNVPSCREKSAVSPGTARSGRRIRRKYRAVCAYHNVPPDNKGYEKSDNYYKHLYPMNKEQYYAMRRYYNQTGDDSEEAILQIVNDINYMPDDWSIKGMKPTMYGIGFAGMAA